MKPSWPNAVFALMLALMVAGLAGWATREIPQAGGWGMFLLILASIGLGAELVIFVIMPSKKP